MIPLTKQAGAIDEVQKLVWNPSSGPMENLLRIVENSAIIFGGGILAGILFVLKSWNISPSRFGRMIDEANGFKDLSDLAHMDVKGVAEKAADSIQGHAGAGTGGGWASPVVIEQKKAGDFVPALNKSAIGPASLFSTRTGMIAAFMAFFGWIVKGLLSPDSKLSGLLRAAGVWWLESDNSPGASEGPKGKAQKPAPTKKTPKQQLEETVDRILGA